VRELEPEEVATLLNKVLLALTWSYGIVMKKQFRQEFNSLLHSILSDIFKERERDKPLFTFSGKLFLKDVPAHGMNFFLNNYSQSRGEWIKWDIIEETQEYDETTTFKDLFIPTEDT
jgi:hypothetical protein